MKLRVALADEAERNSGVRPNYILARACPSNQNSCPVTDCCGLDDMYGAVQLAVDLGRILDRDINHAGA